MFLLCKKTYRVVVYNLNLFSSTCFSVVFTEPVYRVLVLDYS